MNELETPAPEQAEARLRELQREIRRLERRDWWLWALTVVVMLTMLVAVVTLSFPELMAERDWEFSFNINQAVTGLVGMVLLFNTYSVYQQFVLKRLRRQMLEQIEAAVRLQARAEELHKQAVLDPMTGLYNRRIADQRMKEEIARAGRHGYALSVLMIDLNNFKPINDRLGHAAGDSVLKEFAVRLQAVFRASDLVVRMGGDEFMVVLPECSVDQVPPLLGRLGAPVAEFDGQRIPIEYAAGWAGYEPGEAPERLVQRADAHLYENKRKSKAGQPAQAR